MQLLIGFSMLQICHDHILLFGVALGSLIRPCSSTLVCPNSEDSEDTVAGPSNRSMV